MKNSIFKNYLYNVLYQIINIMIPFITIPYISRILGAKGVGINVFTSSVVQYFILFGTVGISIYGQRTIAYKMNTKIALNNAFWEIFLIQFILSTFTFLIFIFSCIFYKDYKIIYFIQSINILCVAIDISWLFMGIENLKKIVVKNIIIKILGVLCVFVFVKSHQDLWKYVFIGAISNLLGQVSMWFYIQPIIYLPSVKKLCLKKHVVPVIKLFIPQIAIQIYVVLDKTMLGILSNMNEVAYYELAEKVLKIPLSIITSLGIVILSRLSNIYINKKKKAVYDYFNKAFILYTLLGFPIMLGILAIAPDFVPWFLGSNFEKVKLIIIIMGTVTLAISWSNCMMQFMVSINRNTAFTRSVIVGAISNFILNLFLIPKFNCYGAAIATVISEWLVTFTQIYFLRNELNFKLIFKSLIKYGVVSLIMFVIIRILGNKMNENIITTLIQIVIGILIYGFGLIILKDDYANQCISNFKDILNLALHKK